MKNPEKKAISHPAHPPLEKSIASVLSAAKKKPITIKFLLKTLSGKGRYLLLVFLSLPFCQPIPLPGLSTLFGLAIALFGISILLGRHVWLPEKALHRTVSHSLIDKIASKALWIVKKIKPFVHQRIPLLIYHPAFRILNGLTIISLGLFLALPLPIPLTNIIPGWIIFLIALGLLEDDGLLILLGYIVLIITLLLITFLIILPFLHPAPSPIV